MAHVNSTEHDREQVVAFLQGRLNREEYARFVWRLHAEPGLRDMLEQESGVEAELECYGAVRDSHARDERAGGVEQASERDDETWPVTGGTLQSREWRELIDRSLHGSAGRTDGTTVIRGRFRPVYALAAVMALIALSGIALFLIRRTSQQTPVVVHFKHTDSAEVRVRGATEPTSGTTERACSDKTSKTHRHEPVGAPSITIPEDKKTFTRISAETGILAEPGTRIRLREHTDTSVVVLMAAGNALFVVGKQRYEAFVVVTPHSVVSVTGTIFRVVVTDIESEITVYEGSVEVAHEGHRHVLTPVGSGATCVADDDSVITSDLENDLLVGRRRELLGRYLEFLCKEGDAALRRRR